MDPTENEPMCSRMVKTAYFNGKWRTHILTCKNENYITLRRKFISILNDALIFQQNIKNEICSNVFVHH